MLTVQTIRKQHPTWGVLTEYQVVDATGDVHLRCPSICWTHAEAVAKCADMNDREPS